MDEREIAEILELRGHVEFVELRAQHLADMRIERGEAGQADLFAQYRRTVEREIDQRGGTVAERGFEFFDQRGARIQTGARIASARRADHFAQPVRALRACVHGADQVTRLDRFEQEFVAAGGDRVEALAEIRRIGGEHDRHRGVFGLLADQLREFDAADVGQVAIDDDDVGTEFRQRRQRGLSVVGQARGHAAFDQAARRIGRGFAMLVDQQHAPFRLRALREQFVDLADHAHRIDRRAEQCARAGAHGEQAMAEVAVGRDRHERGHAFVGEVARR